MKKKFFALVLLCGALSAGVIPEPQSIQYGPVVRVRADRVNVQAPDIPAAKLALEFLNLPPCAGTPELTLVLTSGNADSEAYRMRYDGRNRIEIDGDGPAGMLNGVMTLIQLIRRDGESLEITLAEVEDAPVWKERFIGSYSPFSGEQIRFAAEYKYGGLAYQYRAEWHKFTAERFRDILSVQKRYADAGVMKFMLVYHIYATGGTREKSFFNIASEEDRKGLAERCRFARDSGFRFIMICTDDWTPLQDGRYVLLSPEEKQEFGDSAGRGHGFLMSYLQKEVPGVKLCFCPPVYSLQHTGNAPAMQRYLKELGESLPPEIPIVWTGPKVISREITAAEEKTFSGYAGGHKTFLWDNSECIRFPIYRWETRIAPGLASSGIFINAHGFSASQWMVWYGVGTNAYLWNPAAYDAARTYAEIYRRFRPHYDVREIEEFQRCFDELNRMSPQDDFKAKLAELKQREADLRIRGLADRWIGADLDRLYVRFESPRPQLEVELTSQPPKIDGKLDDPCWKNVPEAEFQTRCGKAVAPGRRTYLRAVFDREAIYFGFRMEFDKPLVETVLANPDGDFFGSSDLVEVFLKPGKRYVQFALDHRGYRFVNLFGGPVGRKPATGWEAKVGKNEGIWTAEIRIPFALLAELGAAPPSDRTGWQANFCREYNAGKELQCWSPTHANSFLNPEMFGTLVFRE